MLDESAIEAMIARQRQVMNQRHEPAPSVRTVKTDEFEVYERPAEPEPAPAAAPRAPPAAPTHQEEFEVFERRPAPQPEPVREPTPPAAPQPVPVPYPHQEPAPTPTPAPTPNPTTEPAQPFAPQPTRRPEVWPPLGTRSASTATAAPASAAPEPEPDVTPRSHAPAQTTAPARPAPEATGHAFPDLSPSTGGSGGAPRLAIVQALFNEEITGDMLNLARQKADKLGAPVVQHVAVPGVYDLPLAVQALLRRDDIDACVVLGCVVTGETKHDELITHATAKTLQEVSLATGKPVGFGVIGPGMTWKQAEARVVNGKHAVEAAVAQWRVLRGLTH